MNLKERTIQRTCLLRGTAIAAAFACLALAARADAPQQKKQSDEVIFSNGERLIGQLERSDNDTLTFKSEVAGEVKVAWSKVKELHSPSLFVVIPKGFEFGRKRDNLDRIPEGHIAIEANKIRVAGSGGQQDFALNQTGFVVDQPTYEKSLERPDIFADWKGSASAGIALVLATEDNKTYTSGVSLVRAIPTEPWMKPENRTTVNFTSAYGELTQPGQPLTKTSIFHADAERDEYFTERLYSFVQTGFDHNYSLGLNLQQTYGLGLGWSVIKGADEAFDLKADLSYVDQQFQSSLQNQRLVGSIFSESYRYKFKRGILIAESLAITPAWNNTRAYSANGSLIVMIPIAKHVSVNLSSADTFLNDPSPGFRKNSFQFSTGLSYILP